MVRQVVVLGIADTLEGHRRSDELDALSDAPTIHPIPDSDEAEWLACGCPSAQVMRTLDRVQAELAALVGDGTAAAQTTYTRENAQRARLRDWGLVAELAPAARKLAAKRKQPTPVEKLASVTVERRPHSWRKWEGETKNVGVCAVCGEKAGYSVNGQRYCAAHEGDADRALRRTSKNGGSGEAVDEGAVHGQAEAGGASDRRRPLVPGDRRAAGRVVADGEGAYGHDPSETRRGEATRDPGRVHGGDRREPVPSDRGGGGMSVTIQIHGASPETYALVGGEEHTAETSRWKTLDIGETHVVIFAPREAEDAGLEEAA